MNFERVLAIKYILTVINVVIDRTYAIGIAHRDVRYFLASESADAHYQYCVGLETYPLFGTPYEEAALWSLFIITATADPRLWKGSTLDVLRKFHSTSCKCRDVLTFHRETYLWFSQLYPEFCRAGEGSEEVRISGGRPSEELSGTLEGCDGG